MATRAAVRELLERAVRAGAAPGLAAGWQQRRDAAPTVLAVGRASVHPVSRVLGEDAWFDLASLTKPLVVGSLAVQALDERLIGTDTSVAEVLPETRGAPLGGRTLRQLLCHSAGLPAWAPVYASAASNRTDDVVAALCDLEIGPPDTHVVYSCPGFITAGLMLERVLGASLDSAMSRRLTGPLGATDRLGYRPGPGREIVGGSRAPLAERSLLIERRIDPEAVPAVADRLPDDGNARFLGGVSGNAGLFGSARGVLVLAMAWLRRAPILGPETTAVAVTDHTPGLEQARGLAWQLAASPGCSAGPALAPSAFGHTGFTGTSLWIDPTREVAMTLLANRVHPAHRPTDLHPLRRAFHRLVVG